LGIAGRIFNDQKYRDEFVSEVSDWIRQNPVGYGVNWACPMDVAIRAVNWLAAGALLSPALELPDGGEFTARMTRSLWEHARFIETHLEWNGPISESRANHFLADIAGLFTLGIFFEDVHRGRGWMRTAMRRLEVEMSRQVLEDGVHFECSIGYHRLCLEMFLWCMRLGENSGYPFSDSYRGRLDAMRAFVGAYTRPDGLAPIIGDNDDGRWVHSGLGAMQDHRYLLGGHPPGVPALDAALLEGSEAGSPSPAVRKWLFDRSGYYVLTNSNAHLVIRAGRLAHQGAHAHNDQLSFELASGREPILVDRGTYVYTSAPDARNKYRGVRAHNTLTVNGIEQNRSTVGVFGMLDDTQTVVSEADCVHLVGRHTGFRAPGRAEMSHTREFQLSGTRRSLAIRDHVAGLVAGDHVEWAFHFAAGMDVVCGPEGATARRGGSFVCKVEFPPQACGRVERFDQSPSYGRLEKAETLYVTRRVLRDEATCAEEFTIVWDA
jgi:hypothetical protein